MKRLYITLILFLLLILEGVALEILPNKWLIGSFLIVPHWVLVWLIIIALFYDKQETHHAVVFAAIFGFLIDTVYTGILGVYMFTYAVTIYLIHGVSRFLQVNFFSTMLFVILGVAIVDISIESIYYVMGIIQISWQDYVVHRLFPTIVANLLFLFLFYPLVMKRIKRWSNEKYNRGPTM
ncbi:rod shape-determining protein MreD [Virgibacillus soli]|uniref:rod shape-determining protein MreD n=1 Tax=Paracerasibacillus soli TaxID=480284 RepID=UPI0035EBB40F